jgi:hypothetical protein
MIIDGCPPPNLSHGFGLQAKAADDFPISVQPDTQARGRQ